MQLHWPWIITLAALAASALLLALGLLWQQHDRRSKNAPLPSEWTLTARPVFSTDERRVYRRLREALPHHIVLAKLPLVRFCQPIDAQQVRYWFDLLGTIHVSFALCSANGRVLAAIDLDTERSGARRVQQIKRSVLGACRIRYLRCPVDQLPSIAELQLLVPQSSAASRAPQSAPAVHGARDTPPGSVAARRRERSALWQDSGFFQDSFFGGERRGDAGPSSESGTLGHILRSGAPTEGKPRGSGTKADGDPPDTPR